jgi:hypothetical protein
LDLLSTSQSSVRFGGKVEFRELSVQAGDDIDVVKEELADGWSLVKNGAGEVGLLPRSYYAVNDHPSPFLAVTLIIFNVPGVCIF